MPCCDPRPSGVSRAEFAPSAWERIFRDAGVGMAVGLPDGTIGEVNEAFARMLGYEPDELIGLPASAVYAPELAVELAVHIRRVHDTGADSFEFVCQRKDGSRFPVIVNASAVRDTNGEVCCRAVALQDISRLDETQERLRRSESLMAEGQALARVGSGEWDLETGEIVVSETLGAIVGLPPAPPIDLARLGRLIHPDDQAALGALLERFLAGDGLFEAEYRFITPAGETVWVHTRATVTRDAAGKPLRLAGFIQDITERKRLQEQIAMAGRLAAVGTLASGVAHELNNPLAYVLGNLGTVLADLGSIREAVSDPALLARLGDMDLALHDAKQGAQRMAGIVADLKILSRSDSPGETHVVDLEPVLESALKLTMHQIRHKARVTRHYSDAPPVRANEARLAQVFVNLLANAAQAIPEKDPNRHEIALSIDRDPDGQVVVAIRDTGAGVPGDIVGRIFDPFFTTKPVGQGMGLGLSISRTIVTAFGGEISFETEPGCGTTFKVRLPAAGGD